MNWWREWWREYALPFLSLMVFSACLGYVIWCLSVVGR